MDQVIADGDDWLLHEVPIAVSLNPPDCEWALEICLMLAEHNNPAVRGSAILGLGQLGQSCPELPLGDADSYVARQALSVHRDIMQSRGVGLCETRGP